MRYFLAPQAALKWLETPAVYHIERDDLYELDEGSFAFLRTCASENGSDSRDQGFLDYCIAEGLLTTEGRAAERPPLARSPSPSLRYLELQLTDRCNLRCRHCYIGAGHAQELSLDQVRAVLRQFEEMQGLRVLLTGGEPLLHSRFDEINALLPGLALHSVLFTNGALLTPARLKSLQVHEVQVSVDGMQAAHDTLRGRGSWELALRGLRLAVEAGFPVAVSTMAHHANRDDFEAMDKLFRDLGVREWNVDIPCAAGRVEENEELFLSPAEGGRYLAYGFGGGMHGSASGFGCGLHLMAVLPDGKAAKCTFYGNRPAGTVHEGLRTCWERVRPIRLDQLACACDHLEECRGGCRYRAERLEGPGGRDLFRCHRYGVIDKTEQA
jgi:radical SAM protein with 4Fe4S-binding SPASM domain